MAIDRKRVRDIMTPNPKCVTEDSSIVDVARIMKEEDTGVVPVVDGKKLLGMITDRDIVVRLIAEGKNLSDSRVSEAMTKDIRAVNEEATVDEVMNVMRSANVRRVPVVNRSNEIVGIVSMGDLAIETSEPAKVGDVVQNISEARPNN